MKFEIVIPDANYDFDPEFWSKYVTGVQQMINRMAVGHFKYHIHRNLTIADTSEDKMLFTRQRMSMYDGVGSAEVCDCDGQLDHRQTCFTVIHADKIGTGNTENLLDASNGLLVEFVYPDHPKAHFRSQSSEESPGLAMRD
jgi:hypothetical protein